jgi:hypothetical protein
VKVDSQVETKHTIAERSIKKRQTKTNKKSTNKARWKLIAKLKQNTHHFGVSRCHQASQPTQKQQINSKKVHIALKQLKHLLFKYFYP